MSCPFIIDPEDVQRVKQYRWHFDRSNGYIRCNSPRMYLHRFILKLSPGKGLVDHINGNPLDNRKDNLRVVNYQVNAMNNRKRINKTGVTGIKQRPSGRYMARINYKKKEIYLGDFATLEEATKVRSKANKLYGFSERHGQ